jgi:hypothetical protein
VIWSDTKDTDGNLLVPINPMTLAANINATAYPLLLGHDPGRPLGKVLAAEVFKSPTGETFVAAVLGFYDGGPKTGFGDLGLDPTAVAPSPAMLSPLPADARIELATDPKEIDLAWLEDLVHSAPITVELTERSNNSAGTLLALITVGLPYAALVWNPFVTTIANEAGKDVYAKLRSWLKALSKRLAEQRHPIIEIQSFHGGCRVSFILRGQDVARHYKAHEALPDGAARAARLVTGMRDLGVSPVRLIYEFHTTDDVWFPSYAELSDGRLISDNTALVAVEQLPSGLSLGLNLKSIESP